MCEFLLKVFANLFEALGRPDLAKQVPLRYPTACSHTDLSSYNILTLLVCPSCGDVFAIRYNTPLSYTRCSEQLYDILINPAKQSTPKATRKVLVPRIRLPCLSISAQLEGIFGSPGIENDVDWWRNLPQERGKYQNFSDGKIWNEVLDPEGNRFFRSVDTNGEKCAPDGEIRIGIALAMDW
jgi:hypothetical protein